MAIFEGNSTHGTWGRKHTGQIIGDCIRWPQGFLWKLTGKRCSRGIVREFFQLAWWFLWFSGPLRLVHDVYYNCYNHTKHWTVPKMYLVYRYAHICLDSPGSELKRNHGWSGWPGNHGIRNSWNTRNFKKPPIHQSLKNLAFIKLENS